MNIKLFLTIKACYKLPGDVTEKIWSIVKTEAKKTIQERIQDMYHRKIEIVRQLFLRLDTLSKSHEYMELNYVYKSILSYAKISNYMYMQDAERYIRNLRDIKRRYFDRDLARLIDKITSDITIVQLIGKARMARLLALRTADYNLSTKEYIDIALSPAVIRIITMIYRSPSDIKIELLDKTIKLYFDKTQNIIFDTRYNFLNLLNDSISYTGYENAYFEN
jgi:hypothetical protein